MQNVTETGQPSIIRFNAFDQNYVDTVNVMVAPLIMGTFVDMFLQGILVVQITNYFGFREVDGPQHRFKWLVIVLGALCLLKSFQNIVIVWNSVISTYANPAASYALISGSWVFYTCGLSTAIIATVVQSFFAFRYWRLTKRWYICVIMLFGMIVSLVAAAIVPVYVPPADVVNVSKWSLVHFVAAIIVDGLITVGTSVYLHSHKQGVQSTTEIIDRLVRMTWQSALPPALCVCVNAVLTEVYKRDLTQIALNTVLPKLYAISLMYTLNMRNELRGSRSSDPSTGGQITFATKLTPGAATTDNFSRVSRASVGAIEAGNGIGNGNGTRNEKRGVLNLSRRLDVHVETHVATEVDAGSKDTMEMNSFQEEDHKNHRHSEADSDVWIQKL